MRPLGASFCSGGWSGLPRETIRAASARDGSRLRRLGGGCRAVPASFFGDADELRDRRSYVHAAGGLARQVTSRLDPIPTGAGIGGREGSAPGSTTPPSRAPRLGTGGGSDPTGCWQQLPRRGQSRVGSDHRLVDESADDVGQLGGHFGLRHVGELPNHGPIATAFGCPNASGD